MGMGFSIGGIENKSNDTKRNFCYRVYKLNFNHKIDSNGKLVLATQRESDLEQYYDFYQGATLGEIMI
jgi:hypothetical protein